MPVHASPHSLVLGFAEDGDASAAFDQGGAANGAA
jgi:hypothetical protein